MTRDNERYLSVHIPKTGGTSMKRFFEDLYGLGNVYIFDRETGGYYRSNEDGGIQNPALKLLRRAATYTDRGKHAYLVLINKIKKSNTLSGHLPDKPNIQQSPSDRFSVIHGNFETREMENIHDVHLVTVVREPLKRAVSHFRYTLWLHQVGFEVPDWYDPNMRFQDFTESDEMRNIQSRFFGNLSLSGFDKIGVTENLAAYARSFDNEKQVKLQSLNTAPRVSIPELTRADKQVFVESNSDDYELYRQAVDFTVNTHINQ